jgi:flagellar protein FlbD
LQHLPAGDPPGGPGKRVPELNAWIDGAAITALPEVEMISLRRLNNQAIMVNSDLIESLESTPDTVVTLTSGNKLLVRDSMEEIQTKIIDFKRRIYGPKEV